MPNPVVVLENQRKHLTRSERAARQAAEVSIQRQGQIQIRCPAWLDEEARQVFRETRRKLRGLQLLDNADAEALAIYSRMVAQFHTEINSLGDRPTKEDRESVQSWARLIKRYMTDLGLDPNSRARLAKKKTDQKPKSAMAMLLDDVSDYMNDDNEDNPDA
jgi:P27 family predicted phage terminase small subunit